MPYGTSDLFLKISKDRAISWVRNGETVRVPSQSQTVKCAGVNFTVDGKIYRNLADLFPRKINDARRLYQDVYGRYVLDMKERYPIFDSYDAMYEDRYYHWYLILDEDHLSVVYSDDGRGGIEVTEDVQKLAGTPYSVLQFWKYLDEEGILRLE